MNEKIKVPAIRFKGFNDEWEEKILGNVTDYKNGKGHEDKQKSFGKYELINLNSISIDGGLKTSGKFVDETDSTLEKDDLVMVLSDVAHGDLLGRVALIPKSNTYVLNQRVALLRPHSVISPLFILYNINAHQSYFKSRGAGMSQLNISKSSVENFYSYIPEKTEQTKVGNYFQQLDGLIALHQQKHDKLLNLKKSLLEKMFPKQGRKEPEIRFKGFIDEWRIFVLGQNSTIKGRLGWKSLKQNEYLDNGPSMIAGRHIVNGVINWSIVDHIPEWRYFESPEIMLKNNDVIFSKDGSLGNPAVIKSLNWPATINSTMMLVRPGKDLDADFFFQVLKTKKFADLIKLKVSGSSIPHLFQADMKEFIFDCPELEEQIKIGHFFSKFDQLINQCQIQLEKLNNIKQACLEKMFV